MLSSSLFDYCLLDQLLISVPKVVLKDPFCVVPLSAKIQSDRQATSSRPEETRGHFTSSLLPLSHLQRLLSPKPLSLFPEPLSNNTLSATPLSAETRGYCQAASSRPTSHKAVTLTLPSLSLPPRQLSPKKSLHSVVKLFLWVHPSQRAKSECPSCCPLSSIGTQCCSPSSRSHHR